MQAGTHSPETSPALEPRPNPGPTSRTAFIQELIRQARINPRLFLAVGDLGFSVVEPFVAEFPERFLNAGVAEQNLTAVAAGLASEGWQVFTYSIANFPTLRCLEQIRNDVCYHRLPVTVVAVGAGLAYGNMGYSHHGIQDLAVMRSLPNLTLLSPADPGEATEALQWICRNPGPSYLRLGKAGEKTLHDRRGLDQGPLEVVQGDRSSGIAFAATGSVLSIAQAAASELEASHGVRASVFSCPWLKPAPAEFFAPLWDFRRIITLEEHVAEGGFGELIAASRQGATTSVTRLALSQDIGGLVGSQEYLRAKAGLTVENAVRSALG